MAERRKWKLGYDADFDTTGVVVNESGPQIFESYPDYVTVIEIQDGDVLLSEEEVERVREALQEAQIQIEYLDGKRRPTSNAVVAKVESALELLRGKVGK